MIALAKFYLMLGLISVYYCNMKAMKLNPKRMAAMVKITLATNLVLHIQLVLVYILRVSSGNTSF